MFIWLLESLGFSTLQKQLPGVLSPDSAESDLEFSREHLDCFFAPSAPLLSYWK